MSIKKLYFLIPEPEAIVSGGNIYNRHLINALNDTGAYTEIIKPNELFFLEKKKKEKTTVFVDTLYLKKTATFLSENKNKICSILIVHHLESLHPPKGYTSESYFDFHEKPLFNHIDGFLTSSIFTANYLKQKKITKPIIAIPPALTIKTNFEKRSFFPVNVLMVANLVERKGILPFLQTLVNALAHVHHPNFKINIIGNDCIEPSYANECKKLIQQKKVLKNTIIYHGEQAPDSVKVFYQRCNLFISTSFMETYGMALQEAVAFRRPIIALDRGNASFHVQQGSNGFLFDTIEDIVQQLLIWSNDEPAFGTFSTKLNGLPNDGKNETWQEAAKKVITTFSTI